MSMTQSELNALGKIESRLARLEALQEANVRTTNELTANVNRLVEKLEKSDDLAREADQRARSAHHRIDEVRADVTWAWRTALGALITGAIALIWKAVG